MAGSDTESEADIENDRLPPALRADPNAKDYLYRDFANVTEDLDEPDDEPDSRRRGNTERSIRVQKFPVKLFAILARREFSDIITWMPHGRAWKVLKPNAFESLVMPLFFEYSNYHSFNRLVNAWSFRRLSSGPDRGSYYHELFLRGKPHLQKYMRRLPKTHKKLSIKKADEPDFYKMAKTSPLPDIPDSRAPAAVLAMRHQAAAASVATASEQNLAFANRFANLPPTSEYPAAASLPPTLASFDAGIPPMNSLAGRMGSMGHGMSTSFREPDMPLPPHPLDLSNQNAEQHYQYQRMRHMQHLQLFQRQTGTNLPLGGTSSDELIRLQQGGYGSLGYPRQASLSGAFDEELLRGAGYGSLGRNFRRQMGNSRPGASDEELLRLQRGGGYGSLGRQFQLGAPPPLSDEELLRLQQVARGYGRSSLARNPFLY